MKKQTLLPLLAALIAFPLHAQAVKETNLTPEEKTLLNAARSKANSDPSVRQANDNLVKAKNEAMLKIDPNVKPILDKLYPPDSAQPAGCAQPAVWDH